MKMEVLSASTALPNCCFAPNFSFSRTALTFVGERRPSFCCRGARLTLRVAAVISLCRCVLAGVVGSAR